VSCLTYPGPAGPAGYKTQGFGPKEVTVCLATSTEHKSGQI